MFHQFLIAIKNNQKRNVLSSMQSIMSLIIGESDDNSQLFLSTLLAGVKQAHVASSNACNLATNVIKQCEQKLKPFLTVDKIEKGGALEVSVSEHKDSMDEGVSFHASMGVKYTSLNDNKKDYEYAVMKSSKTTVIYQPHEGMSSFDGFLFEQNNMVDASRVENYAEERKYDLFQPINDPEKKDKIQSSGKARRDEAIGIHKDHKVEEETIMNQLLGNLKESPCIMASCPLVDDYRVDKASFGSAIFVVAAKGRHEDIYCYDGNPLIEHELDWMKHSENVDLKLIDNSPFEMSVDWTFENPLFELDDGTPIEVDQESQLLILERPWIETWLLVLPRNT